MFNTHYYRGHNSRDESTLSLSSESSGEIGAHKESSASGSDSMSEVDLESGALETKVHSAKKRERDCRICHLGLESCGGIAIELGCSCKGDLGASHKKCAETWFKIKGNMICEICGATAVNVAGDHVNEAPATISVAPSTPVAPVVVAENRTFWHGRRIMNFLLACMVFAFIISWLFHFKVLR